MSTGPYGRPGTTWPGGGDLLTHVAAMVHETLQDYGEWTSAVTPDARLDADLGMQSVEFAALQARLTRRWGPAGDLTGLVRMLDLTGLADLTVATVAGWVGIRLGEPGTAARPPGTGP